MAVGTTELLLVIKATNQMGPALKVASEQIARIGATVDKVSRAMSQVSLPQVPKSSANFGAATEKIGEVQSGGTLPSFGDVANATVAKDMAVIVGWFERLGQAYQALRAEHPLVVGGFTKIALGVGIASIGISVLSNIVSNATLVFGLLGAGLGRAGPRLAAIGGRFRALTAIGAGLIPIILSLGRSLMLIAIGPVGLAIAAIAGLILIGVLVWKNWDTIREKAIIIFTAVKNFIVDKFTAISDWVSEKVTAVKDFFVGAFQGIKDWLSEHWKEIITIITMVFTGPAGLLVAFGTDAFGLRTKMEEVFGAIVGWLDDNVAGFFRDLPGRIGGFLATIGEVVAAPFRGAFEGVRSFINAIADAINGMPSISVPDWFPGIGGRSFSLPNFPKIPPLPFANGAILRRPVITLAEREPEVIAPISALSRMLPAMAGGPSVTIINRGTIVHDQEFVDLLARAYHTAQRQGRVP